MGLLFIQESAKLTRRMSKSAITDHYGKGGMLLQTIVSSLEKAGFLENLSIDHLSPVDEFHIGGREATQDFLKQLDICKGHKVLDIGCGIGGPSRFVASHFDGNLVGVDLTPEFISCGEELNKMVGLSKKVKLLTGSALELDSVLGKQNNCFDSAFMLHVGMNIEDKNLLMSEIANKLRPGGLLGIYDVMRCGENAIEDLDFPVPWATSKANSFVAKPEHYRRALDLAGMKVIAERNRFDFAVEFFSKIKARKEAPIVGLHLIMDDFPQKMGNMIKNLKMGRIAPVEMIAKKR